LQAAPVEAGEPDRAVDDAEDRLDGRFAFFVTGFAILALPLAAEWLLIALAYSCRRLHNLRPA
jgi:hypothetical protein